MEEYSNSSESEKLLNEYPSPAPLEQRWRQSPYYKETKQRLIIGVLLFSLLSTNGLWFWSSFESGRQSVQDEKDESAYYGSPATVEVPFNHEWVGMLEREQHALRYREEEWRTLFPDDGGSVALSREFARQHNLPDAAVTPEDPDKMIYLVAGYHQLHCAHVVRDAIYYLNGTLTEWPDETGFIWDHILHCMDAVRQGLECFLDPTLIDLDQKWPGIPNGQKHLCRNKNAMRKWTDEHSHPLPVDVKVA